MATQGDRVYAALNATETTETLLGTITIPNGVNKITAILAKIMQPTTTVAEQISGYVRLAFSTVAGRFKFPAQPVRGPAGTLADAGNVGPHSWIPVNIPVPQNGSETVAVYMTGDLALTGTCTGEVSLLME